MFGEFWSACLRVGLASEKKLPMDYIMTQLAFNGYEFDREDMDRILYNWVAHKPGRDLDMQQVAARFRRE